MRFLVLGAGKQGTATALDLLLQKGTSVVLADKAVARIPAFLNEFKDAKRLELLALDLEDHHAVAKALTGMDCALSAVPYYFNADLTRLAIEAGVHFADLGGNTEIVLRQKKLDAAA